WRSIRLSTAYPDFFRTQLRAILRASRHGEISLLFPMVSTLEEVQRLKRMVRRTRRELQREGEVFNRPIPLGVMLEVPAATLCGEMAGRPRCFLPLFGMGLRQLSMSPAFVPSMKEMIHRLRGDVCREVAERVLQMSTVGEIRGFLTHKVKQIWPDVSLLD